MTTPDETNPTPSVTDAAAEPIAPAAPTAPTDIPPLPLGDRNENPPGMSLWQLWREDFRTHGREWFNQGFITLVVHRFGNWRMGLKPKLVRAPFSLLYNVLFKMCEVFCGIKLSYTVKLGRRVKLEHFGGMILGARQIGDDVIIRQNTTFGLRSPREPHGKPIIEDRVDIGCGAVILGHVRIGHDSVIGANAVVTKDVPPWSVVVGVPGRVVKTLTPDASGRAAAPAEPANESSEPQA